MLKKILIIEPSLVKKKNISFYYKSLKKTIFYTILINLLKLL